MDTLKDFLWPIVAIGGLGAFIDFLIGRTGQERAKDFLLRWWMRFEDVRWRNFGREEGLFAAQLIEKCFGKRIWSVRRIAAALLFLILFLIVGYSEFIIFPSTKDFLCFGCKDDLLYYDRSINMLRSLSSSGNIICAHCTNRDAWPLGLISLFLSVVAFSISVSFTILLTSRMASLCGVGELRNIVIFVLMLFVNYLILAFWFPVTQVVKFNEAKAFLAVAMFQDLTLLKSFVGDVISAVFDNLSQIIRNLSLHNIRTIVSSFKEPVDLFALSLVTLCPSLFRFLLSIVFVSSFLLRPLVMRPVSLVWARIIESDKPVFTVIFGGAAAFATALNEAAKHL
jgi:hypothetical protein